MKECLVCKRIYGDSVERCKRDNSPLKMALPGLLTIASRYRIIERIASGSMGVVYRGIDLSTDQPIAIKLISPEFVLADANTVTNFFYVAEAMKIEHRNIVRVLDYGKSAGNTLFLVMEYLEGCTLQKALDQDPTISIRRAIQLIGQICDGLIVLHKHGYLYGILRPANIMIYYDEANRECVKLLDCGFSWLKSTKLCSALPSHIAQRMLDQPDYLAPEVCDGQDSDARSEVYAMGAILYHLLAGRPPFVGPTLFDVMQQHLTETPQPLSQFRAGIPEGLEMLVTRALDKDLSKRIQTPAAFSVLLKLCQLPSYQVTGEYEFNAAELLKNEKAESAATISAKTNVEVARQADTHRLGSEFLNSIEEILTKGSLNSNYLSAASINAHEIAQQLAVQFENKGIWQEGINYVPHRIKFSIPGHSPEQIEAYERLLQSDKLVSTLYRYIGELGFQIYSTLQLDIEVAEDNSDNQVRVTVEWPDEPSGDNGLARFLNNNDEPMITKMLGTVISRPALLQSINACAHHEQFLISSGSVYIGRFRNILDHATGALVRRNDFAFLQSAEREQINLSVSRQHARIDFRDGEFFITDLGSKNGTFIKRKAYGEIFVPLDPESVQLQDKDIIRLGQAMLSFELLAGNNVQAMIERLSNQLDTQTDPGSTDDTYRTLAVGVAR